jgi:hypothetical protein
MKGAEIEVVTDYKDDENFKSDRQIYVNLSEEVKSFHSLSENTKIALEKLSLLKSLVLAITNFDSHLKMMISKYPEYYTEMKPYLDELIRQNGLFLSSTKLQLTALNKSIN